MTDEAMCVAALVVLGRILKGTTGMSSRWIPHALLASGCAVGALLWGGASGALRGASCASAAVFGHQLVKQSLTHDATH